MDFPVLEVLGLVDGGAEPNVALVVHPHANGLEIGPEHPLPDIELLPSYDQWPLNVLLDHPGDLIANYVVQHLVELVEGLDASASRHAGWLDDPDVLAVEGPLWVDLLELLVKGGHLLEQLLLVKWLSFLELFPG